MNIDESVNNVLQNTQKRIDIVRMMYENDVALPYHQQSMSKLRDIALKIQMAYYRKITDNKPVAYWINRNLDGRGSYITEILAFLQEHSISFDGVPLHTKITGHHRFVSHRREEEWKEHPMYGSYLFTRTPYLPRSAGLPTIDIWNPVRMNRWEIAKCDFTVDEYDHVKNMIMLIKPKMMDVLDTLTEFDFVPNVENKDLIRVGYDYSFANKIHKWNNQSTMAGSYKHIQHHKEKIIQIGIDYLTELWNNQHTDITIPHLVTYFNTIPLLINYNQYTVDSNDMINFLTSTKRLDTYDELVACNKFVNDVADEILKGVESLGILRME